jgi:coenzyme F420 biosynthesis associated uncharacterized protein
VDSDLTWEDRGMGLASDRLLDWNTARSVGARTAGRGPELQAVDRARLHEDFAEVVPVASGEVQGYTRLEVQGYPARPWVMTRSEWIGANLRTFNGILEPFAERVLAKAGEGRMAGVRRATLGVQVGGLLGYLSRKVLGQFDVFLPPDDDGLIYFVGPNIAGVERRFGFPERDFRLWVSLHEVAHRVQFGAVPWLRGYIRDLAASYLRSMDLDPRRMVERVRHAAQAVRSGEAEWRGLGWVFLLMTPDQRDQFRRMQAAMTLLEGHGSHVMNAVGERLIPDVELFRRRLEERRRGRSGVERSLQRTIGFDIKARQYEVGERFVSQVVDRSGMEGFNLVWESPANLPTLEEVGRPEAWLARVGAL